MHPKRQSVPEAGAYRILRLVLTDLRKAERVLATSIEDAAPDPAQTAYLAAIRAAIANLHLFCRVAELSRPSSRPPRPRAEPPRAEAHSELDSFQPSK
jgi:hypothetical protein